MTSEYMPAAAANREESAFHLLPDPAWSGYRHSSTSHDGWLTLWRVDPRGEDLSLTRWAPTDTDESGFWLRAATPSGVVGRWAIGSEAAHTVRLELRGTESVDALGVVDVLADDALVARVPLQTGEQWLSVELPAAARILEIWLPSVGRVEIGSLELDDDVRPAPRHGTRWVAYGSSITQCADAAGPSETWPAIVARRRGWELLSLGLGGECHLDPPALRTIEAAPADIITLCIGINIWGAGSFGPRTLAAQAAEFIAAVIRAHPDATIGVITPLLAPEQEGVQNAAGMTLDDVRRAVAHAAKSVGVEVIDGRGLWTEQEAAELLIDVVHPGPDGYRLLGERLGVAIDALTAARR